MNRKILILLLLLGFSFLENTQAQANIPELNKQVISYVKSVIGKKVERGECWDLANQALTLINADWDKRYIYGNKIDPKIDKVFPGDMIQFENVKIQYKKENTTYTELMPHHTAIIYKVLGKGVFEIAHQNTEFSKRKVGISQLNLNYIITGNVYFYRPTKKLNNE
jgi:hypothetical protein